MLFFLCHRERSAAISFLLGNLILSLRTKCGNLKCHRERSAAISFNLTLNTKRILLLSQFNKNVANKKNPSPRFKGARRERGEDILSIKVYEV